MKIDWHDNWILENAELYERHTDLAKAYEKQFGVVVNISSFRWHCCQKLGINRSKVIVWDDEWIRNNIDKYSTYSALAEAYNESFDSKVNSDALNAHCKSLGIDRSRAIDWHDDWIKENYLNYSTYKDMADRHNELFGTSASWQSLKHYAKYKLGISKPRTDYDQYTDEQKEWLNENYPRLGCRKTAEAFNEKFGTSKTSSAMKNYGAINGIKVDDEVSAVNKIEHHIKPIGSMRKEGNRVRIKTEDGWEQIGRAVVKKAGIEIPKGHSVIHLDGDASHYDLSNLMVVPQKYCGLLLAHGLRSECAEITKAGVGWCDLYVACEATKRKLNVWQEVHEI